MQSKIISEQGAKINLQYAGLDIVEWDRTTDLKFDDKLVVLDLRFDNSYESYSEHTVARRLTEAKNSVDPFLRSDGIVIVFLSKPKYFTTYESGTDPPVYNKDILKEAGIRTSWGGFQKYDCTAMVDEARVKDYLQIANKSDCYISYGDHNFSELTELIRRGKQGKVCGAAFESFENTGNGALIVLPRPDNLSVRPNRWFQSMISISWPFLHDQIKEEFKGDSSPNEGDFNTSSEGGPRQNVRQLCVRFPHVAQQLQYRHEDREPLTIRDEHDVQDLLHALLWIEFDDIRDEEQSPSHGGSASRIDFLLKDKQIGLEVKIAYDNHAEKKLKNEIAEDKEHYTQHPDCEKLFVLVYDPDLELSNPHGFERDLSNTNRPLETEVIVSPK